MAILEKCANCGREGGYAEDEKDKICARCKRDSQTVEVKATKQKDEE